MLYLKSRPGRLSYRMLDAAYIFCIKSIKIGTHFMQCKRLIYSAPATNEKLLALWLVN